MINPKKFPGFSAHYYGEETDPEAGQGAVDDIGQLIGNVFDNPVFLRLAQVPDRIRESEKLVRIPIADVPVWVSLDVLVEDGQGGFVIVDDYGSVPACRQAIHDYREQQGIDDEISMTECEFGAYWRRSR